MTHAPALRQVMLELDVPAARALWSSAFPHLPAPTSDKDALTMLHVARTAAASIPLKLRAWSHCWLKERGYPSQLPDPLKPHAERMYPKQVGAVGIAVKSNFVEVRNGVRGAMEYAVMDCYANGDTDPVIVKRQMMDARARERRGLGLKMVS